MQCLVSQVVAHDRVQFQITSWYGTSLLHRFESYMWLSNNAVEMKGETLFKNAI